jgi:hypothetical protein
MVAHSRPEAENPTPARGTDKLSDRKAGESGGPTEKKKSGGASPPAKPRGKRGADIGRALRSVYDETLRENVPDDFLDLLGKLS